MPKLKQVLLGVGLSFFCGSSQFVNAQTASAPFSDAVIAYGFLDMLDYTGTLQSRYERACYSTRCDLEAKQALWAEQGEQMPVGVHFNVYHPALTRAERIQQELGEDLPLLRQELVKQQYALEKQLRQLYTAEQRQRYAEHMRRFLEKYAPLNTVRRFEGHAPDGVDLGWAYLQSERDYFKKLLIALDECPQGCDYLERKALFTSFYTTSPFEYRDFERVNMDQWMKQLPPSVIHRLQQQRAPWLQTVRQLKEKHFDSDAIRRLFQTESAANRDVPVLPMP